MAVPPPMTKADLRKILKQRRQAFVSKMNSAERCAAAVMLCAQAEPHLEVAKTVAIYLPIGSEADTLPLIDHLSRRAKAIALPHVAGRSDTPRFLAWAPGDPLIAGPLGLRQPETDAPEIAPDVILTPLLGFNAALDRIGYGAGHYDRAFAAHPGARRIGLAWSVQYCDEIPRDGWDVPLHAIATEREWITV